MSMDNYADLAENYKFVSEAHRNLQKRVAEMEVEHEKEIR